MRLYRFLRYVLRAITKLYFLRIDSQNPEAVPESGPVILAANHPSSILDSVLLSTQLPRPVNYLAKSELFRSPFLAKLYSYLGAIPLKRGRGERAILEAFEHTFERLEAGRCVGIFPEGRNSPQLQIANLRSGTARLALEVEARNQYRLGLVVVPVGINFEGRELFMSSALLRFGKPIQVADYAQLHRDRPDQAVRQLTADIEYELKRQANHIEDLRLGQLISDLGALYSEAIKVEGAGDSTQPDSPRQAGPMLKLRQLLARWFRPRPVHLEHMAQIFDGRSSLNQTLMRANLVEPQLVETLKNRVEVYKAHLRQVRLKEDVQQSFDQPIRERLLLSRMTVYALGMAPFAIYGLLHHLAPWMVTRLLARRFHDEALRTFAYFGIGVLTFIGAYVLYGLWLWQFTHRDLTNSLVYLATLPPTGLIALHYRGQIAQYRDKILVRTFFQTQETLVRQLQAERQAIIHRLELLHERYGQGEPI
ncbi:MAG: 1-acyl-sn-glycerol-3-phosphate acyltransferase [Saccharospirillum sp.]